MSSEPSPNDSPSAALSFPNASVPVSLPPSPALSIITMSEPTSLTSSPLQSPTTSSPLLSTSPTTATGKPSPLARILAFPDTIYQRQIVSRDFRWKYVLARLCALCCWLFGISVSWKSVWFYRQQMGWEEFYNVTADKNVEMSREIGLVPGFVLVLASIFALHAFVDLLYARIHRIANIVLDTVALFCTAVIGPMVLFKYSAAAQLTIESLKVVSRDQDVDGYYGRCRSIYYFSRSGTRVSPDVYARTISCKGLNENLIWVVGSGAACCCAILFHSTTWIFTVHCYRRERRLREIMRSKQRDVEEVEMDTFVLMSRDSSDSGRSSDSLKVKNW